ncbi:MAG: MFS transporter [Campylobacteraceae bacterium 4484_166]|nr:MAG: MFS transporter [Campylobacteraceae bacterium 4484_166]
MGYIIKHSRDKIPKLGFINLSGFYFWYFAAIGVYVIFFPKLLFDIGYKPVQIGVIMATAPLMRFISPFFFLKHIKLDKTIFKLSLYTTVLSLVLFYITIDHFWFLVLNNVLLGLAFSLTLPYVEVIAISYLGKQRYGKSRLYGSVGFLSVALILPKLSNISYISLDFFLLSGFWTLVFGLFVIKLENTNKNSNDTITETFSMRRYIWFWISLFFMQISMGGFYNFFTIYETNAGFSLEIVSYLWAFGVFCEMIMLYFQAPILKNNLVLIIKISIFVTILRWLILYIYPQNLTLLYLSQAIHAFSFSLYHTAVVIFLYQIYKNKKLAQQFMFGVAYGLGGFVGAITSGWFYGEYLFLYCAVVAMVALVLLYQNGGHD